MTGDQGVYWDETLPRKFCCIHAAHIGCTAVLLGSTKNPQGHLMRVCSKFPWL